MNKTKKFFENLVEPFNAPNPSLGEKRNNYIFLILPLTLEGDRRWWGWYHVEEEAKEGFMILENNVFDVVRYEPIRWLD